MKRAVKIAVLLGAAAGLGGLLLWLGREGKSRSVNQKAAASAPAVAKPVGPPVPVTVRAPASAPERALPAAVPQRVRQTVWPDAVVGYVERVEAVRALGTRMTGEEVAAFYAYLRTPGPVEAEDQPKEHWLRNELMDRLVSQEPLPSGLADLLVSIYEDRSQSDVMRDYSIQHMSEAYKRVSDEDQAVLLTALRLATKETDTSIAGTALLALYDVARTDSRVEPASLCLTALKLAGDDSCGELSRITAVQVCARLRLEQAAPSVMQLARAAQSVPLKIAAIAALGEVGDEQARGYLRQLASSPEPRFQPAIVTALRTMSHRLGN